MDGGPLHCGPLSFPQFNQFFQTDLVCEGMYVLSTTSDPLHLNSHYSSESLVVRQHRNGMGRAWKLKQIPIDVIQVAFCNTHSMGMVNIGECANGIGPQGPHFDLAGVMSL